jgi:hypothetical protein
MGGLKKPQRSLKAWGKQKWRTKSGKPSTQGPKATGERYLPAKAIKALSPSEYASSTAANPRRLQERRELIERSHKWQ